MGIHAQVFVGRELWPIDGVLTRNTAFAIFKRNTPDLQSMYDEEHHLQLEEQVLQHSPPAKFPCKSSISIHSFRIPEILFCSMIGKESIDSFPTPGILMLSAVLLLPDPRNPYLQYYLHYEGYKVNTAVPQTNNGRRVQIGSPLTAESACPFAGFLYIRREFSSPASTKGKDTAAANLINSAGGLRIFSNGEVRIYKAVENTEGSEPWIGSMTRMKNEGALLLGTENADQVFSDAEKVAWCVDPYKNYCAKVLELYRDGTEEESTGSNGGSLQQVPFEVIEIFNMTGRITIRSFNPIVDNMNCPGSDNTPTDCKASSDSAGIKLEFQPIQCPSATVDVPNEWDETTHKNAPEKYLPPSAAGSGPPEDCVGAWQPWSLCSDGRMTRVYTVSTPMKNGGDACEADDGFSMGVDCGDNCIGNWRETWGPCVDKTSGNVLCDQSNLDWRQTNAIVCEQTRPYWITREAEDGGKECPHKHGFNGTRVCGDGEPCIGNWEDWGSCEVAVGSNIGVQRRIFNITQQPSSETSTQCG